MGVEIRPGWSRPRTAVTAVLQTIFDVARNVASLPGPDAEALRRLYAFTSGEARCRVGAELSQKYGMPQDNSQLVVSITNKATLEQAWYNEARTRKPQTFKVDGAALVDPTDGGRRCDFCNWQSLTAEDVWGRFERPHAVTGSNLFKYGEPAHGLVLFKHHDPLAFSREQLSDFLAVSADWFDAAARTHPGARHPFFIWNCGPRAGASQFHGHGQLMLTTAAVPAQARLSQQAALHAAAHPGSCYYSDLVRAHAAVGLARVVGEGEDRCWVVAHLAPQKDMEVLVLSGGTGGLRSPAFLTALHAALRALVDRLGVQTFNCGILDVPLPSQAPVSASASAVEDGDGVGGGVGSCRTTTVGTTLATETASGNGVCWTPPAGDDSGSDREGEGNGAVVEAQGGCYPARDGDGDRGPDGAVLLGLPHVSGGAWRPMMARLVSRGKVTSPASDFGCLEVVGHASIGHTDPFVLIRALDEELAAAAGASVASEV